MSFLDHLDEFRQRLIYSALAIAVAFVICFAFSKQIFNFLEVPVAQQIQKLERAQQASNGQPNLDQIKDGETVQYTFVQETAVGGVKVPLGTTIRVKKITKDNKPALALESPWNVGGTVLPADKTLNEIFKEGDKSVFTNDENKKLVLRGVTSSFMIKMQIALYAGLALAIPFLIYQLWAFISPGLYKHERRYVVPVMMMATVFFTLGATFAYVIAFPAACDYLLGLAAEDGFRVLLDAEDYLNLIILIMLGLGVVFQIPTISFLLGRIGLLTPKIMWKAWRYAVVIIMILSAVLTPTADAFNMLVFAAPMLILYFLSIGIVWMFGKQRRGDEKITALATTK
ncbi:MAG: Sec-independent protein translocase protein TatC [Acidobacteria bacterium]|nr:Sec-independent protein translocase protein TatC [Acidobacteriota bacterium]